MKSEVATLLRQIELECEALRRMMADFQVTGAHDIINHKFEAMTPLQEQLATHIGEEEAARITVETYIHIIG
ncbi:hypothetical protein KDH_12330 [Dictyobacter sp. S3.2.2.5]|uniref:DUF2383 domain-containing protein n=1 Tax=Dictyobacter halimunensis TaxID=3026934 RepID=A0ABQ6FJM9_9CHLR|nr:hypothetical protein KDH_12330 [Dictyobacter sp. S3.2.2.5]